MHVCYEKGEEGHLVDKLDDGEDASDEALVHGHAHVIVVREHVYGPRVP